MKNTPNQQTQTGPSLVQGSAKWLAWRNKGLGSSDAAVLLGVSPWKTFDELLLEKRGLWKAEFNEYQVSAMERGKRLEPLVRQMVEMTTGVLFPDESAEDREHPYMRVSFDGVNWPLSRLIEIKCGNRKDHVATIGGTIPEKYVPQVQWQMMVGQVSQGHYVSWSGPPEAIEDFEHCKSPTIKSQLVLFFLSESYLTITDVATDVAMQTELRRRAIWAWDLIQDPKPYVFSKWERK